MEITKELLNEIQEKAIAICNIRGKKTTSHDYMYISVVKDGINVVFRDTNYYESDDIHEEFISITEMNGDVNELLEQRRKEEAEWEKAQKKAIREQKKAQKEWQDRHDMAEWKRLNKKYGNDNMDSKH